MNRKYSFYDVSIGTTLPTLLENFNVAYNNKVIDYSNKIVNYYGIQFDNERYIDFTNYINKLVEEKGNKTIRFIECKERLDLNEFYDSAVIVDVASDGGSVNNFKNPDKDTYASYGFVITGEENDEYVYQESGYEKDKSNNWGELTGAVKAITTVVDKVGKQNKFVIRLICDSQYVTRGITEYINGWMVRGWKNNQGKDIPYQDLWNILLDLKLNDNVLLLTHWYKGHTKDDNFYARINRQCDLLCNEELKEFR